MGGIPVANPTPPRRLRLPRRGLRVAVLMLAVALLTAVAIGFAWPTGSKIDEPAWFTAGSVSDFSVNQPVRFKDQRFWLVRLGDDQFIALLQRSPYRGCTIIWRPDFEFGGKRGWFRDPCHSDTFSIEGAHAFGPAPRDMDRFPIRFVDRRVQVLADPKHVVLGSDGGPVATPR